MDKNTKKLGFGILFSMAVIGMHCSGSVGFSKSFVWNINTETGKADTKLDDPEKKGVQELTGLWEFYFTSTEGENRKYFCFYDKNNKKFHFITIKDPFDNWLPGELRFTFSKVGDKQYKGVTFMHGEGASGLFAGPTPKTKRTRETYIVEGTLEGDKLLVRFMEEPGQAKNIDGTPLHIGSVQILRRLNIDD